MANGSNTLTSRKAALRALCAAHGIYVRTWSPGDGVTRYRFFRAGVGGRELSSYFGPENGVTTVLGITAAENWAEGYANANATTQEVK